MLQQQKHKCSRCAKAKGVSQGLPFPGEGAGREGGRDRPPLSPPPSQPLQGSGLPRLGLLPIPLTAAAPGCCPVPQSLPAELCSSPGRNQPCGTHHSRDEQSSTLLSFAQAQLPDITQTTKSEQANHNPQPEPPTLPAHGANSTAPWS